MKLTCSGVMTALVTPFDSQGSFDAAAMERLVVFQIEQGINGLVVCGSTGEAATLNDDEYREVVKTVVRITDGRVPIIAGAGSNNTAQAVKLSQIAEQAGVDGLLQVTPPYNKPSDTGIVSHFQAIAESTNLPIIAYNVPGRTGRNMSASLTLRLAKEIPSIIGVKEASGNVDQVMEIIAGREKGFLVLSGDDALALPMIAIGADGLISVASNEIPAQMSQMVQAARDGGMSRARKLHYEWLDLMQLNFSDSNPVPVKTALAMMGHMEESFRLPLVGMEADAKQQLKVCLERHGLLA